MKSRERRSQRDYTLAFKLSVVDQVEKGEMSYKQAQYRYVAPSMPSCLVKPHLLPGRSWSRSLPRVPYCGSTLIWI